MHALTTLARHRPESSAQPLYYNRSAFCRAALRGYLRHHRAPTAYFAGLWESLRRLGQRCVRLGHPDGILSGIQALAALCCGELPLGRRTAESHLKILRHCGILLRLADGRLRLARFSVGHLGTDTATAVAQHAARRRERAAASQQRFRARQRAQPPLQRLHEKTRKTPIKSAICAPVTLPSLSLLKPTQSVTQKSTPATPWRPAMDEARCPPCPPPAAWDGAARPCVNADASKKPQEKPCEPPPGEAQGKLTAAEDPFGFARLQCLSDAKQRERQQQQEHPAQKAGNAPGDPAPHAAQEPAAAVSKGCSPLGPAPAAARALSLSEARHLLAQHAALGQHHRVNLLALLRERPTYDQARQAFELTAERLARGALDNPGAFLLGSVRKLRDGFAA